MLQEDYRNFKWRKPKEKNMPPIPDETGKAEAPITCSVCGNQDSIVPSAAPVTSAVSAFTLHDGVRCSHCVGNNMVPLNSVHSYLAHIKESVEKTFEKSEDAVLFVVNDLKKVTIKVKDEIMYIPDWLIKHEPELGFHFGEKPKQEALILQPSQASVQ